ncbi:MAG: hypothetical protein K6347_07570 [Campylobacterales bacterium]
MNRGFFLNIGLTFIGILCSLAYKSLAASLFPKEELTRFLTLVDLISFVMLLFLGFRSSLVVAYVNSGNDAPLLSLTRLVMVGVTLLVTPLLPMLANHLGIDLGFGWIIALLWVTALWIYVTNQLAMYRLYGLVNAITLAEPLALLVALWVVSFWQALAPLELLATASLLAFGMLSMLLLLLKGMRYPEPPWQFVWQGGERLFLRHALLASLEFGFGMLSFYLAVYLYAQYGDLEEMGDFQVVTKTLFMHLVMLFIFPVFRFLFPEVARMVAEGDKEAIEALRQKMRLYAFGVGVSVWLLFYIGGELLIDRFFGSRYEGALVMTLILFATLPFSIYNSFYISLLRGYGRFGATLHVRMAGVACFLVAAGVGLAWSLWPYPIVIALAMAQVGMYLTSRFISRTHLRNTKA